MNNEKALNQALPAILAAIRPILDQHSLTHVTVSKMEFADASNSDLPATHSHAHVDGADAADEGIIGLSPTAQIVCRVLLDNTGKPMRDNRGRIITVCS